MNASRIPWFLVIAILFAGLIIAVAAFVLRSHSVVTTGPEAATAVRPVSATDHLIGNPSAKVAVIEYSDFTCEFCQGFHQTIEDLVTSYGASGNVVFAYREFPVGTNPGAAEAAECAAVAGGEQSFWRFLDAADAALSTTVSPSQSQYVSVAGSIGIPKDTYTACLSNHATAPRIQADLQNAIAAGGTGAPFTVVIPRGAAPIPVSGAIPFNAMKKVIDTALSEAK